MKSVAFTLIIGSLTLLFACKGGVAPAKKPTCLPEGKYLNYTVLKDCPNVLPDEMASYVLEIDFKAKDTADMFNGFERFRVPYTGPTDSCTYTFKNATQFGDMKFRLEGDTIVQLYDSAWTHLKLPSVFRRIDDQKPWRFKDYLNECVIIGTWTLIKEGIGKDHKIIFLRSGQVDGMKPFLTFDICYAGDCLEETDPFMHTMDFLDDHGKITTYAFEIDYPGRRKIKFYSIGDPVSDQKGGRKIGPLAFTLKQ